MKAQLMEYRCYRNPKGQLISIVGPDPLHPDTHVLVRGEDGAEWGVEIERVEARLERSCGNCGSEVAVHPAGTTCYACRTTWLDDGHGALAPYAAERSIISRAFPDEASARDFAALVPAGRHCIVINPQGPCWRVEYDEAGIEALAFRAAGACTGAGT